MGSERHEQDLLETVREIRDAQRKIVELLSVQRALVGLRIG